MTWDLPAFYDASSADNGDATSALNGDAHPVTEHDETLSPGELQAALSNAIVRIMRDFYGKRAARSRTTIFDEYVFVILEDVLTTAEMTLRNGGAGELVRKVRHA